MHRERIEGRLDGTVLRPVVREFVVARVLVTSGADDVVGVRDLERALLGWMAEGGSTTWSVPTGVLTRVVVEQVRGVGGVWDEREQRASGVVLLEA